MRIIIILVLSLSFFTCIFAQNQEDTLMLKYRFNKAYPYWQDKFQYKPYQVDEIIKHSKSFIGVPYLPSGKNKNGFDCSGFIFHIHKQYGIFLPYCSSLYQEIGVDISKNKAKKGDLIMFKGYDIKTNVIGHVGMVISELGEPIQFIHSASSKGVCVNFLESIPYYNNRFLGIKRIIE